MMLRLFLVVLLLVASTTPASADFLAPALSAVGSFLSSGVGRTITGIAVSIGLGFLSQALTPSRDKRSAQAERGITQLIRASAEPHRIIWGERSVSGVLVFGEVTGSNNEYLHMVITLAGHQVHEITTVFFNDVGVDDDEIDGSGDVIAGRFSGKLRIKKHLGLDDQAADSDLVSAATDWTSSHRLRGVTYLYVRMEFDRDIYPTGVPNVKAMVKGRLVADPRDTAITITSSSVANPTVITTSSAHGLAVGGRAFISGHTGATPEVIGEYQVLSAPSSTTITVDENVTVGGTGGSLLEMKWSDNAALCLGDYLLASFGLNADQADEIDDAKSISAANICDEEVNLPTSLTAFDFTAAASTDILTQTVATGIKPEPLHQADGVDLTTTGTLPAPLAPATRYFAISVSGKEEPFIFRLATSIVNATAGVAIDITNAGSGTHTLTRKSQTRYTVNGVVSLGDSPVVIAPSLIFAMGGQLTYTQGKYTMFAGAFNGPATIATLDEDSLRGEIVVRPRPGKADIHNSVRGIFTDRDNKFLETDFPPVVNSTFLTADKEEKIFKDIVLSHVTDTHRAQRLAVLVNQRDRQGLVVDYPASLIALEVAVGDVVNVTNSILRWTDKEFEVLAWSFSEGGGIDLVLKETASGVYSFNPETDQQVLDIAPNTNLPGAFDAPAAPTGLVLKSGTAELLLQVDGTIISRIRATWIAPTEISVTSGGRIEVDLKKSADVNFVSHPALPGDASETFLVPVVEGESYDVRLRAVNRLGVVSDFVTVPNHVVAGESAPPLDVSNFSINIIDNIAHLTWDAVADIDLSHYRLRWASVTAGASWGGSVDLIPRIARPATSVDAPARVGSYLIKAVDRLGLESTNATAIASTISAILGLNVIETVDEHSAFSGAKTNVVAIDNIIKLGTTNLFDSVSGNFDDVIGVFDGGGGTGNVATQGTYDFATVVDLTSVFTSRVSVSLIVTADDYSDTFDSAPGDFNDREGLFDGETPSLVNVKLQISITDDDPGGAPTWTAYRDFVVGDFKARGLRFRAILTSSVTSATPVVSALTVVVDMPDRTISSADIIVASGGSAISFSPAFKALQGIGVAAQDLATGDYWAITSKSATGFTIQFFNSSDVGVSRTFDYVAKGYGSLAA